MKLARRSWDINMHWDDEVGEGTNAFHRVGVIYLVGPEDVEGFRAQGDQLREADVPTQFLGPEDVRRLFPYLTVDDVAGCLHEPEAGYGDGSTSAVSLVAAARKRGAPFQSDTKALSVLVVAGRVRGVARERLAWGGKLAGAYERPRARARFVDIRL